MSNLSNLIQPPYPPGTQLPFEEVINFRELGGYPAADGRTVKYGCFYRSGALNSVKSPADQELLNKLNLKLILDLRSKGECEYEPDPILPGVKQLRICAIRYPDGSEMDFSPNGIEKLDSVMAKMKETLGLEKAFAQLYINMPFGNPAFQTMFRELEAGNTPILFHCSAGKDRTGIAAILILLALGVSKDTALEDYMLTNTWRKQLIEKSFEQNTAFLTEHPELREMVLAKEGVSRKIVEQALNAIEKRYDSYEAYFLAEFGLDADRLEALRDRYLE